METMLNVYDRITKQKTAVLQNAFDIVETHELNQIYSLSFTLPASDEKVAYCLPRHYVRWGDDGELYRIKSPTQNDSDIGTITYECEHVITTLCDTIMFGSYDTAQYVDNLTTRSTIEWLLSKQKDWTLDVCDFNRKFEYLWEQENLLNALYSIPKEFALPYKWTFNTTVYPWRISLEEIDTQATPEFYLRAKSNILSSGTSADYANICTRIYPLGYGEGVNQLNIKDVNNGVPYLQSPDSIVSQYGIVEKVLVDRRFENAETLKAYAQSMLDVYQTPTMSRTFDVTDLYPLTNDQIDNAEVGKICEMTQDKSVTYITKTRRQYDKAGDLQIDLSTKATDITSSMADLADRVRIESVYAQGATQLYQHSKDANATPDNGMTINLYFPEEMRQINKVLLKMSLKKFRSYSSTTTNAGGTQQTTSSGGSSNQTTSNGGSSTQTSSSGGGSTQTSSSGGGSTQASTSGGGSTQTSSSGGGSTSTTSAGGGTGITSTGTSTISAAVTSGASSTTTTKSGGAGSDIVTSKTYLDFNTEYDSTNGSETANATFDIKDSSTMYSGKSTTDFTDGDDRWQPEYPGVKHYDLGYYDVRTSGNRNDSQGHYHAIWFNSLRHNHGMYHYHGLNLSNVGYHKHALYKHRHRIYHEAGHSHTIDKSKLGHTHGMDHTHTISLSGVGSHSHTFSIGSHTHSVTIPNHTHSVTIPNHTHNVKIPNHTHSVTIPAHTHTVSIPNHTHTVTIPAHTHNVTIPSHTHNIIAGIYESGNPSAFDIYVGNTKKTTVYATSYEGDITEWLLNNKNEIPRNQWIDITIKPNDLAYVVSSVFVQGFVQSRGGGNY